MNSRIGAPQCLVAPYNSLWHKVARWKKTQENFTFRRETLKTLGLDFDKLHVDKLQCFCENFLVDKYNKIRAVWSHQLHVHRRKKKIIFFTGEKPSLLWDMEDAQLCREVFCLNLGEGLENQRTVKVCGSKNHTVHHSELCLSHRSSNWIITPTTTTKKKRQKTRRGSKSIAEEKTVLWSGLLWVLKKSIRAERAGAVVIGSFIEKRSLLQHSEMFLNLLVVIYDLLDNHTMSNVAKFPPDATSSTRLLHEVKAPGVCYLLLLF